MTKPQLEDGFTRIANELFEAILKFGFSEREMSVVFAIVRKTYGYGKKEDDMSASQIGDMIGKHRNHVTVAINKLVSMNVLNKRQGFHGMILGVNKEYRKWDKSLGLASTESVQGCTESVLPKLVPNRLRTSTESVQVDSTESVHTKENLSKETIKRKEPREEITFNEWMEQCKQNNVLPIPLKDPVFDYAVEVELDVEYVRFAWVEFKRKYAATKKKYKNWNQHFQNAVRENWYGVWFDKDGAWQLTTRGKQIQKEIKGRA